MLRFSVGKKDRRIEIKILAIAEHPTTSTCLAWITNITIWMAAHNDRQKEE